MNLKEVFNNPHKFPELKTRGYCIYGINNIITNKWYIGMTRTTLYDRLFITWGGGHLNHFINGSKSHLYNSMRKYGLENFRICELSRSEEDTEEIFIRKYDSYFNGYNGTKNGLGVDGSGTAGGKWINDGESEYVLDPGHYKFHTLDKGRLYIPRKNSSVITDGKKEYLVPKDKLNSILIKNPEFRNGRGPLGAGTKSWVNNGIEYRQIKKSKLDTFLKDNPDWKLGFKSATLGKVQVSINGGFLLVDKDKLDEYLINNPGSFLKSYNEGRVNVNNGEKNLMIPSDKLSKFLDDNPEYRIGRTYGPTKGRKWVTNGEFRKYIPVNEVKEFLNNNPGWYLGFSSGNIWINNGNSRRLISKKNLDQFLLENPDYKLGFSID